MGRCPDSGVTSCPAGTCGQEAPAGACPRPVSPRHCYGVHVSYLSRTSHVDRDPHGRYETGTRHVHHSSAVAAWSYLRGSMGGAIGCCLGHHRAGQAPVPVLKDLWGNLSLWSKPSCPWGQGESREAGKPWLSLARPVGLAAPLFLRRLVTPPQNAVRGTTSPDEPVFPSVLSVRAAFLCRQPPNR